MSDQLGLVIPPVGSAGPAYAAAVNDALAKINSDLPWRVSRSVGNGMVDNTAALEDDYGELASAGGGVLFLPPGVHNHGELTWDSNVVSVLGPGSGVCALQAIDDAPINIRPSPITVVQGPKFGGFTVQGDPSLPTGTAGIKTGDIIGAEWDDIVIQGFAGLGSTGLWIDNINLFTERNVFGRVWLNNNKESLRLSHTGGDEQPTNSFGYNRFLDLRINVWDGQTAIVAEDDINLYSSILNLVCNVDGAGTVYDIRDSASFNGVVFGSGAEQTGGTGGIPYKVAATAFVFGYGMMRFENFATDGILTGGARHTPAWRIMDQEAVRAGVDSAREGQIANFLGSGNPANVHPLLWDAIQNPFGFIGFLTGPNNASPYVCMYDSASSAFIVYKRGSGSPANMAEVQRVTNHGHVVVSAGTPATATNGAGAGTGAPTPATSGNNTKGTATFGTGTSPAAGLLGRVTFAQPWPVLPEIVLQPLSSACHDLKPIVLRNTDYFEIHASVTPAASQPLGTYNWSWHAKG
ncbi:MAG TPA: hypothetical protein VEG38_04920 [Acidimicrobiia bacterium]|nr:hypothetical protein [Acidimicrobiia bacterium]